MADAVRYAVLEAYARLGDDQHVAALVGHGRGHGLDLLRRDERDVHERQRG
jgi:hypothetical protein